MIKEVPTTGTVRCSTCRQDAAAVDVILGNRAIESTFHLCRKCALTLMENLGRKEAPANANTD
jgi:protein-arginine kinase activator protein McsA